MLVLSRKLREQIQIGDHITVTILRVKGNAVRLGIDAPRDVKVVRKELPPEASDRVGRDQRTAEQESLAVVGMRPSQPAIPANDHHVAVFVSDPHRDHVVEITASGNLQSLKRSTPATSPQAKQDECESPEGESESGTLNRVAQHLRACAAGESGNESTTQNAGIERLRQIVAAVSQSNDS